MREICRYCEGIDPVDCPGCNGEVMVEYYPHQKLEPSPMTLRETPCALCRSPDFCFFIWDGESKYWCEKTL